MLRWMLVWSLGVSLMACASQSDAVRVARRRPAGCEELGRVEGQGTSETTARRGLREEALPLGADTVVIDEPVQKGPAGRTRLSAVALRCLPAREAPSAGAEQPALTAESAAAEEPAATMDKAELSLEARLRELQRLRDEGLITQEDYDARKQELLQEL